MCGLPASDSFQAGEEDVEGGVWEWGRRLCATPSGSPAEAGGEQWDSTVELSFSDMRGTQINDLPPRKSVESISPLHPKAHSPACWLENRPLDPLFMLSQKFSPTAGWAGITNHGDPGRHVMQGLRTSQEGSDCKHMSQRADSV